MSLFNLTKCRNRLKFQFENVDKRFMEINEALKMMFCIGDINGDFAVVPFSMRFTMTQIYEVVSLAELLLLYVSAMNEYVELVESLKLPCQS